MTSRRHIASIGSSFLCLVLMMCIAAAVPGQGLVGSRPGDSMPSFVVRHVTGSHAGRSACPVCVHGQRPALALFLREGDLEAARGVLQRMEAQLGTAESRTAVGYVVLVSDRDTPDDSVTKAFERAFASLELERVFLTVVRPESDPGALAPLRLAKDGAAILIGYVNRKVVFAWEAPTPERLGELPERLRELVARHESYAESAVRMCPPTEPGDPFEIHGRVRDENGQPLALASVIAYATDAQGRYTASRQGSADRLPRLRAVAVTDEDGFYRFAGVRPAPYADRDEPAHVHLHFDAPVHRHTYRTVWFDSDPRITPAKRAAQDSETVILPLRRRGDGVWVCRLDVQLAGA